MAPCIQYSTRDKTPHSKLCQHLERTQPRTSEALKPVMPISQDIFICCESQHHGNALGQWCVEGAPLYGLAHVMIGVGGARPGVRPMEACMCVHACMCVYGGGRLHTFRKIA